MCVCGRRGGGGGGVYTSVVIRYLEEMKRRVESLRHTTPHSGYFGSSFSFPESQSCIIIKNKFGYVATQGHTRPTSQCVCVLKHVTHTE